VITSEAFFNPSDFAVMVVSPGVVSGRTIPYRSTLGGFATETAGVNGSRENFIHFSLKVKSVHSLLLFANYPVFNALKQKTAKNLFINHILFIFYQPFNQKTF
jgi:hypothetical protein